MLLSSCKENAVETTDNGPKVAKMEKKDMPNPRDGLVKEKPSVKDDSSKLPWLSIEEAASLKNKGDKKYFIDVYTDWCGWCKRMDKTTFSDPEVQKYLEENFHVVKFNAEQKTPIEWEGSTYNWKAGGRRGVNALTMELIGARPGYPTMVYLDKDRKRIKASPGYKDPAKLLAELKQL